MYISKQIEIVDKEAKGKRGVTFYSLATGYIFIESSKPQTHGKKKYN